MYRVLNKSRQGIPVIVKQEGKLKTVNLAHCGEFSHCFSEEITFNMKTLQKRGFIRVTEAKDGDNISTLNKAEEEEFKQAIIEEMKADRAEKKAKRQKELGIEL